MTSSVPVTTRAGDSIEPSRSKDAGPRCDSLELAFDILWK